MRVKEIIMPNGTHYIEIIFDNEIEEEIFENKCGETYTIQSVDGDKAILKEINGCENDCDDK